VHHSTDYEKYHKARENADEILSHARNILINDQLMSRHGSLGIHHPSVDDTCRMAFDIHQVIRHERWKINPNRNEHVVSSHIHFTYRKDNSSNEIKCELKKE
jgi:hypothetical protein